ncbi:MAG: TadE family protein [Acidimicrobiales bacterium]
MIGMRGRGQPGEQGSLTVELVMLTPALVIVALTIVVFGRVSESRQQVSEAARAGAEAAAVGSDPSGAVSGAVSDATAEVDGQGHTCTSPQIDTDVSHFYPGGFVTVTVTCQVTLSDLSVPGVPGSTTIRASSTAPIDPYRSVG